MPSSPTAQQATRTWTSAGTRGPCSPCRVAPVILCACVPIFRSAADALPPRRPRSPPPQAGSSYCIPCRGVCIAMRHRCSTCVRQVISENKSPLRVAPGRRARCVDLARESRQTAHATGTQMPVAPLASGMVWCHNKLPEVLSPPVAAGRIRQIPSGGPGLLGPRVGQVSTFILGITLLSSPQRRRPYKSTILASLSCKCSAATRGRLHTILKTIQGAVLQRLQVRVISPVPAILWTSCRITAYRSFAKELHPVLPR